MGTLRSLTSLLQLSTYALLSGLIICSLPAKAAEGNIQSVERAWKERQERVRSMQFTWTESRLHPRGSAPFLKVADQEIRPKDISYDVYHRLDIDGEKLRYSYDGKTWKQDLTDVVDMNHTSAFDGQTPKLLNKGAGLDHPIGTIFRDRRSPDLGQLQILPILLCYVGVHPTISPIRLVDFSIAKEKAVIKDSICDVLKERSGLRNGVCSIYVDPKREYSAVRYSIAVNGNAQVQLDIEYSFDPSNHWVPAGWDLILLSPSGVLQQHSKSSVSTVKINPSLPPDTFQLDFPAGAWITDQRTEYSNGLYESFLVKSNGTKRVVGENELTVPYEQLMKEGQGAILASRWLIIINIFVLLPTAGYLLWRVVKRMRRSALS